MSQFNPYFWLVSHYSMFAKSRDQTFINRYLLPESLVFTCARILFLVFLLFVALLDPFDPYLASYHLNFKFFINLVLFNRLAIKSSSAKQEWPSTSKSC